MILSLHDLVVYVCIKCNHSYIKSAFVTLFFVRNDILLHRVSGSRRLHNLQLICPFARTNSLKVLIFVLLLLSGIPYLVLLYIQLPYYLLRLKS